MEPAKKWFYENYHSTHELISLPAGEMIEAFKAGAKSERIKIAEEIKAMKIGDITTVQTIYNTILKGNNE